MDSLIERNQINIEDEMRRSYLDYAMSVIIGRALPDDFHAARGVLQRHRLPAALYAVVGAGDLLVEATVSGDQAERPP